MSYKFNIETDGEVNIHLEGTWTEHHPGTGIDEVEPITITEHVPGLFLVNRGEADDWDETIVVSLRTNGDTMYMNVIVHDIYGYTKTMAYQSRHFDINGKTNVAFAERLMKFLDKE